MIFVQTHDHQFAEVKREKMDLNDFFKPLSLKIPLSFK